MSIIELVRDGRAPDSLGIDDICTLVKDTGRYDSFWLINLAASLEKIAYERKFPVEGWIHPQYIKGLYGLNRFRRIAHKELLEEPMFHRDTVETILKYLAGLADKKQRIELMFNKTDLFYIWLGHDRHKLQNPATPSEKREKQKRKTAINYFLYQLWIDKGRPNAVGLVRAIKPLVKTANCPVRKYHGYYDEVCVEWKHDVGSKTGKWGKKTFQNKVTEFKKEYEKTFSSDI